MSAQQKLSVAGWWADRVLAYRVTYGLIWTAACGSVFFAVQAVRSSSHFAEGAAFVFGFIAFICFERKGARELLHRSDGTSDLGGRSVKADWYAWTRGFLLGAVALIMVLQWVDADRSKERQERYSAALAEERSARAARPIDYPRVLQLSEKAAAIMKEKERDPWILRNLSVTTSNLIILATAWGWVLSAQRKKQNA